MRLSLFRRSILFALALLIALAPLAAQSGNQKPKAKPPKSLRLYVLDGGSLDIPDTAPYRLKKEDLATKNMSVAIFLIVHPKGTLIWDTGAVPDGNFPPGGGPGKMRYATATKTVRSQLAEIGYMPSDIQYLVLSHFHWDHIGNSNLFAGSTWLVTKAEQDIMFGNPPSPRTEPQNFSALKDAKTVMLTAKRYDVFGDGSVVILASPGHSPGHQCLFLKLKKTGPVVLSGDLYHYPEERTLNRYPTFEFNKDISAVSRKSIDEFLKKTGAQLWIEHDFATFEKLKKAPEFYE